MFRVTVPLVILRDPKAPGLRFGPDYIPAMFTTNNWSLTVVSLDAMQHLRQAVLRPFSRPLRPF